MAIRRITGAGVGLVVGIIILALLVWGGIWLVRERGEQARREEAITIADEQLQAESDQEVAIDIDGDAETKTSESDDKSETEGATSIPETGNTAEQPASVDELPQTGPEANALLAVGALSFAIASYIYSRKLVSDQL